MLTLLMLQQPEEMQRLGIRGMALKDGLIERSSVIKLALLMPVHRVVQLLFKLLLIARLSLNEALLTALRLFFFCCFVVALLFPHQPAHLEGRALPLGATKQIKAPRPVGIPRQPPDLCQLG